MSMRETAGGSLIGTAHYRLTRQRGFTLLELMVTTAIIGVLLSVAVPYMQAYTVRAQVTEGLLILSELRRRVETEFYQRGRLTNNIPTAPPPDGQIHGGPWWSYETLFGQEHYMWDRIEYQPKGPHRVIALRAHRREEWLNSDIGLHFQVKLVDETTLNFRCTVNETQDRIQFVPATCQDGSVNDWTSW